MGASAADPSQVRPPLPEEPEPARDEPAARDDSDPAEPPAHPSTPPGDAGAHLGEVIANRFRLVARIHTSSSGAVYRAEDLALARPVALRLLTPILSRDAALLERLQDRLQASTRMARDEVRVLGDIVDLIDLGRSDGGQVFVVTDFIHGENLSEQVAREGPLPWTTVRPLMVRACQILHLSHEHGAVRLDLQTRHLFPVRDKTQTSTLKILSPGLQLDPALSPEMIRYAAPEQITRAACDRRTDIYALGVIMYELLTGQVPFADAVPAVILARHLLEPPPPLPTHLVDAIPPAALAIVHRALAKQPAQRWPTMKAMANAMAAIDFGPCDASGTLEVVDGEPTLPSASSASMHIDPAAAHGAATPAVRPRTFPPLQNAFSDTPLEPSAITPASAVSEPSIPPALADPASSTSARSPFDTRTRGAPEPSALTPADTRTRGAPEPSALTPADTRTRGSAAPSAMSEPSILTPADTRTRGSAPSAMSEPSILTPADTLTRRSPEPSILTPADTLTRGAPEASALTEPSTLTDLPAAEPSALTPAEPSTLTRVPAPEPSALTPAELSALTPAPPLPTLTRVPAPEPSALTPAEPPAPPLPDTSDSSSRMAWGEIIAAAEEAIAIVAAGQHSGTAGDSGVFIPQSLLRTGGAASASQIRGRRPPARPEPSLAETVVLPMSLVRRAAAPDETMQLEPEDLLAASSASMSAAPVALGPDDLMTGSYPAIRTRPPPLPLEERITTAYPTVSAALADLPSAVTAALNPSATSGPAPLTGSGEHPHESTTTLRVADERPAGVWQAPPPERSPWLAWAAGLLLFVGVGLVIARMGGSSADNLPDRTAANRPARRLDPVAQPARQPATDLSHGTSPAADPNLAAGPAAGPPDLSPGTAGPANPPVALEPAAQAPAASADPSTPAPATASPTAALRSSSTAATPTPASTTPATAAARPSPTPATTPAADPGAPAPATTPAADPGAPAPPPRPSTLPAPAPGDTRAAKPAASPDLSPKTAPTTPAPRAKPPKPTKPAPSEPPPAPPKRKSSPGAQAPDAGHETVGGSDPLLAAELLRSAEQSAARGEHGQALGLATQSFHAAPSPRALQVAGEAACRLGNVGKARWARQHLSGGERQPVEAACAAAGLALD